MIKRKKKQYKYIRPEIVVSFDRLTLRNEFKQLHGQTLFYDMLPPSTVMEIDESYAAFGEL